jgi:hypothetical protein
MEGGTPAEMFLQSNPVHDLSRIATERYRAVHKINGFASCYGDSPENIVPVQHKRMTAMTARSLCNLLRNDSQRWPMNSVEWQ